MDGLVGYVEKAAVIDPAFLTPDQFEKAILLERSWIVPAPIMADLLKQTAKADRLDPD